MSDPIALWTSPAPLWGRFGTVPGSAAAFGAGDQAKPAILRFASDEFMEQLLATLLGTMQAPIAKFVQTLNEVPGKFVRTVAAVRDQKEKAAA